MDIIQPISFVSTTLDASPAADISRWRYPETTIAEGPATLGDLEFELDQLESRLASAENAYTLSTNDENPVIRKEQIARYQPDYISREIQIAKTAESIRRQLADLSEPMRAGGLRLEDEAELSRANALLPTAQIAVSSAPLAERASELQTAIYLEEQPMTFALALVIPAKLSGLSYDELSRTDQAAYNDLKALLVKVRAALQDKRGLAHAEQARELRNRAETLKRDAGANEPPAPWRGPNDVSWG
jgi:hypothetical protein